MFGVGIKIHSVVADKSVSRNGHHGPLLLRRVITEYGTFILRYSRRISSYRFYTTRIQSACL